MSKGLKFSMAMAVFAAVLVTVVSALLFWVKDAAAQSAASHYSLPPDVWRWALASAAAATGISTAAAAHAVARLGSAAIGALAEKPDLFGRLLIFVGLAEGIAIYGLIVSILILNRLA
jgi:V/A-type H+-transporting ATPase subunit K